MRVLRSRDHGSARNALAAVAGAAVVSASVSACSGEASSAIHAAGGNSGTAGSEQSLGAGGAFAAGGPSSGGTRSAAGGAWNAGGTGVATGGTSVAQAGSPNTDGGSTSMAAGGAAATRDGGAANSGSAGAAGAAGGCHSAGLLFCDDFETGTTVGMPPPAPAWALSLNGAGTVVLDGTTPAHSGGKSVHVNSGGGYQTFFVLEGAPVFPAAAALYLRVYVRLGAAMSSGHNTYYKAGAPGAPSSDHETRIGVMNSMLMINQPAGDRGFLSNQNYYNDGNKPGVVFAPQRWTCVEALFDPTHSTFDIWVDGKEVPDLHRTDWQQDPLGSFHFGFEKYAGPDADVWYDDIAVSEGPIGCD